MRIIVTTALVSLALGGVVHAKDMKSCTADWKTAKAAHTTQKHKDFMSACLAGSAAAAPVPVATPALAAKSSLFSHRAAPATSAPTSTQTSSVAAKGPMPAGATAQCKDGTWSMSKTHSGSCSHHGGVAKFLK
jgi:hypothetical protein